MSDANHLMQAPNQIVFVEDDENDIFVIKRALDRTGLPVCPTFMRSFAETCVLLSGIAFVPCLLVTDLKLIGEDGFDVITWVREQAAFKAVPTWILTSSDIDSDRRRAVQLGARFFVKPCCVKKFAQLFIDNLTPLLLAHQKGTNSSMRFGAGSPLSMPGNRP